MIAVAKLTPAASARPVSTASTCAPLPSNTVISIFFLPAATHSLALASQTNTGCVPFSTAIEWPQASALLTLVGLPLRTIRPLTRIA